ncbi:exported hypothetical protein [Planktothrix sp. PCC 11201]|nr:exported hypothetical protein [Planktothrix sp. PCC 11201]
MTVSRCFLVVSSWLSVISEGGHAVPLLPLLPLLPSLPRSPYSPRSPYLPHKQVR